LLALAGARVIKLESVARPDGARAGPTQFYDLLNAGKQSVAIDFGSPRGRDTLRQILERVDIVIESARPRALAQLGIDAEAWVSRRPNLTWVSITGYGRTEPEADWVAFGDDAAVGAGLSEATVEYNQRFHPGKLSPQFCGDAIADPLTGMHAAVAALASWQSEESRLLDVSLCGVVRHLLNLDPASWDYRAGESGEPVSIERDGANRWQVRIGDRAQLVASPVARSVGTRAATLGADTEGVLASLGVPT
jgi:crotonobetainyl-CoA:carnitine CoA-transferase CaiB-like acyl-CoA transferase